MTPGIARSICASRLSRTLYFHDMLAVLSSLQHRSRSIDSDMNGKPAVICILDGGGFI